MTAARSTHLPLFYPEGEVRTRTCARTLVVVCKNSQGVLYVPPKPAEPYVWIGQERLPCTEFELRAGQRAGTCDWKVRRTLEPTNRTLGVPQDFNVTHMLQYNFKYYDDSGHLVPVESWVETLYATDAQDNVDTLLRAATTLDVRPRHGKRKARSGPCTACTETGFGIGNLASQFRPGKTAPIWLLEGVARLGGRVPPPQSRVPSVEPETFDPLREDLVAGRSDLVLVALNVRSGALEPKVSRSVEMDTRWKDAKGRTIIPAHLELRGDRVLSGFHLLSVKRFCECAPEHMSVGNWWVVRQRPS